MECKTAANDKMLRWYLVFVRMKRFILEMEVEKRCNIYLFRYEFHTTYYLIS